MGKKLIFLLFFTLVLAIQPSFAKESDYFDEDNNPVFIPDPKIVLTTEKPGPWKKEATFHDPVVKSRNLVRGLETTRVVKISAPHHPMSQTDTGPKLPIKAIYLVEKDGQMIGYQPFSMNDSEAVFEISLNGVINYLEIYVECRQHGIWLKKVRLT